MFCSEEVVGGVNLNAPSGQGPFDTGFLDDFRRFERFLVHVVDHHHARVEFQVRIECDDNANFTGVQLDDGAHRIGADALDELFDERAVIFGVALVVE